MKINFNEIGVKADTIKDIEINNIVSNHGNSIPNQYEVYIDSTEGTYRCFYSYKSLILVCKNGKLIKVGSNYDYSRTTGKYRNDFLRLNKSTLESYMNRNMYFNKDSNMYELL